MRRLTAILCTLFLSFSIASAQTESRISWEKDFKKALVSSRQSGKPVLVFFTVRGCEKCKEIEEQFWSDEKVASAMNQIIAVKINPENEKPLAQKFNAAEPPFVALTDPLGNLISFHRGFDEKSVRRLNLMIKEVVKDFSGMEKFYQAVEADKDNGTALLEIADFYRNSGIIFLSSEFYKKAAKTSEVSKDAGKKERIAFALGINAVGYRDYKEADEYLESYLKNYPKGTYRETALTLLVVSSANQDELKESDKYLTQLKTEFPDSKNVAVANKAIENAKSKRKN